MHLLNMIFEHTRISDDCLNKCIDNSHTPFNERKRNFCLELEDEFHFLLECKLYITLRKRILPKYYWNRPNMLNISDLISTDNVKLLNLLAKYLHKAFDIRNNYVNNQVK